MRSQRISGISFLAVSIMVSGLLMFEESSGGRSPIASNIQSVKHIPRTPPKNQIALNYPIQILIPKIHLSTTIEEVGLTKKGALGVPKKYTNAAWFNLGPRPGEKGNAVIDGHFGYVNKNPGAFNDLHKLKIGDTVTVLQNNGVTHSFIVRESHIYKWNEKVPQVFISDDTQSHLNLITCQGVWNPTSKSYPFRLVIFTDKIP
ncbi:class F sortase [Candidatus Gracilibacteria bacterium]|nr:class F sortase [Candidatus Gracilibacteria bacterium]